MSDFYCLIVHNCLRSRLFKKFANFNLAIINDARYFMEWPALSIGVGVCEMESRARFRGAHFCLMMITEIVPTEIYHHKFPKTYNFVGKLLSNLDKEVLFTEDFPTILSARNNQTETEGISQIKTLLA